MNKHTLDSMVLPAKREHRFQHTSCASLACTIFTPLSAPHIVTPSESEGWAVRRPGVARARQEGVVPHPPSAGGPNPPLSGAKGESIQPNVHQLKYPAPQFTSPGFMQNVDLPAHLSLVRPATTSQRAQLWLHHRLAVKP